MGRKPAQGRKPKKPWNWLFALNAAGFATVLLTLLIWVGYYTDWWSLFLPLIEDWKTGVGAAASFIALLFPKVRRHLKPILSNMGRLVMNIMPRQGMTVGWLTVALAEIALANFLGSIQIKSIAAGPVEKPADRKVWVYREGASKPDPKSVPVDGHRRWPFWTRWWSPTQVRVKVFELPDRSVVIGPWRRPSLIVPDGFRRVVVLLKPTIDLIDLVRQNKQTLVVAIGKRPIYKYPDYDGHALWIGCDEDMPIPAAHQTEWVKLLDQQKRSSIQDFWLHPATLSDSRIELKPGEPVHIELRTKSDGIYTKADFKVKSPSALPDLVQVEDIDAP